MTKRKGASSSADNGHGFFNWHISEWIIKKLTEVEN